MFNSNPFDLSYGDWLNHQSHTFQQQQIPTSSSGDGNLPSSQGSQGSHSIQPQLTGQQLGQQISPQHGIPPPVQLGFTQNPYALQLNAMAQSRPPTSAPLGQGQIPLLWDPNTNPYLASGHGMGLGQGHPPQLHPHEMNTVQQLQLMILQEQQNLDVTLKDEDPSARFKRYQAAYAKILQHQSYGQHSASLGGVSNQISPPVPPNQFMPGRPNSSNQVAMMNPLMNPMFHHQANPATSMSQRNNHTALLQSLALSSDMTQPPVVPPQQHLSNQDMETHGNKPSSAQATALHTSSQLCAQKEYSSLITEKVSTTVLTKTATAASSKSTVFDSSSMTSDSALGSTSLSGSVSPENENLRQSMTNSKAHANRIKEGVVASAAQLTPGLFSNADNIQDFLGLAENPQIHVPCTAKCYHKCKLGVSCPRHAHKHHERKIRKQKQAAAAAAAAAAATQSTADDGVSAPSVTNSCKENKSIETTSSMSVCSDTFNNLDKKSGKDGKKRTFLDLYEVYNVIGVGGGGMVYSGRRIQDKLPVAIKRVMREKVKRWETVQGYQVPQEIALMLRCYGHPGIIKLVDWYECLDSFILIMERPERAVDLFDYIREIGRVPEKEAAKVFTQVLEAAIHIQNCGVVHRDIKDENIIINRDTMEAKLIDFGCGTLLKDGAYRDFSGTPEFYPPEWFVDREYFARTACVWSLGVLLFDMTQGEIPFKQKDKIVLNEPTYKHPISDACQNLIRWCMSTDQNNRPTLEQVQCHMWVIMKGAVR